MVRIHFYLYFVCQQSKSPCIIALNNGGSKAPIRLSGRGRSCLTLPLNLGCLGQAQCQGDLFSPIQPSLSDNFSNKIVRDGMFGLGMAPKEILSRLFSPFNLKILDLYLETWLWSSLRCAEKALHRVVDIWDYVKIYTFNNFVYF